ncbi:hypothetical protein F4775DRAFT_451905 [Biscogniauxia sp. FL1348]|nr:hypothetical protein F4775DRAFT_451905 [Biscogniauxia sp. FL1348]
MQPLQVIAIALTVYTGSVFACTSGSYQCYNPSNGTSSIQVCSNGTWVTAANCQSGWKCAADSANGCTCQD